MVVICKLAEAFMKLQTYTENHTEILGRRDRHSGTLGTLGIVYSSTLHRDLQYSQTSRNLKFKVRQCFAGNQTKKERKPEEICMVLS